jgi:hypothetical protein
MFFSRNKKFVQIFPNYFFSKKTAEMAAALKKRFSARARLLLVSEDSAMIRTSTGGHVRVSQTPAPVQHPERAARSTPQPGYAVVCVQGTP